MPNSLKRCRRNFKFWTGVFVHLRMHLPLSDILSNFLFKVLFSMPLHTRISLFERVSESGKCTLKF